MTHEQQRKIAMSRVVEAYVDRTPREIRDSMPHFDIKFAAFKMLIIELTSYASEQIKNRTGLSEDKAAIREAMMVVAINVSSMVLAYANAAGDEVLYNNVNYRMSYLVNSSGLKCQVACEIICSKATEHLAEVEVYGLSSGMLAEFHDLIGRYRVARPKPRLGINAKKAATGGIKTGLMRGDKLFEAMDGLVRTVRLSAPEFHTGYFISRKLVAASYRELVGRGRVTDEAGAAMGFVKMSCAKLKLSRKISKNGTFRLKGIADGIYEFVFERAGYESVVVRVVIFYKVLAEIEVVMNSI